MIKINLLPSDAKPIKVASSSSFSKPSISMDWAKDISLYIGIGVLIALAIIMMVIHVAQVKTISSIQKDIDTKNRELQNLQTEVRMVEELKRQKAVFQKRLNAIKTLVGDRVLPVHLWDEINRVLPKFTWLTSLKQTGGMVTIKGKAFTKMQISELYNRLNDSPYFSNISIEEIKEVNDNGQTVEQFTLKMSFQTPLDGANK